MSTLLVPSQYITISAAITAAASGDAIVISAGTYSEHLNLSSKTNILVRAAQGEQVIVACVLTSDVAVNVSSSTDITLRGITFRLTGSTMGTIVNGTSATSLKVLECTFDTRQVSGADTADSCVMSQLASSTATNPFVVARCIFLGPGTLDQDNAIYFQTASAGYAIVEGNLFYGISVDGGSDDRLVRLVAGSGGGTFIIRNNTAVRCRLYKGAFLTDIGAQSGTNLVYNNIVDECVVSTPAYAENTFHIAQGAGTGMLRHNMYYAGSVGTTLTYAQAFTGAYADAANCTVNLDPAVYDGGGDSTATGLGRITITSPAYRAGDDSINSERRPAMGPDRIAFADTTPSIGCYEMYDGDQVIHVKHHFTAPVSGFSLTYGTGISPTAVTSGFDTPFDVALHVELAIQDVKHNAAPFTFWYMPGASHRYRAAIQGTGTFTLTTSGIAGTIMGSGTHSGTADTG